MLGAYYNEIDPYAAQWLRNLIAAGHIAAGDVDERSIVDVRPDDIRGYTQCHFFAGIGVWSHALRRAGWDDSRPVWTGSCPCQPFSAAGKRTGTEDERHLWPEFFRLIRAHRPVAVLGEQVASRDGLAWLDIVHADLEGEGYAVGAVDLCAAGVGAPHIRQRLFFVADSVGERRVGIDALLRAEETGRNSGAILEAAGGGEPRRLADALPAGRPEGRPVAGDGSAAGGCGSGVALGDANDEGPQGYRRLVEQYDSAGRESAGRHDSKAGFWHPCDWLPCIDGKARPVEPGTFPLAHGVAGRVGRLRAYGNAIVAPVAAEFIRAFRECRP